MLFSVVSLAVAVFALPGVQAVPSTTKMVMDDGITLQLADGGKLQRIDVDGNLLGEKILDDAGVEHFQGLVTENGKLHRRDSDLSKRACLIGHPCTPGDEQTCWYNGCAGCLVFTSGAGACYGSVM